MVFEVAIFIYQCSYIFQFRQDMLDTLYTFSKFQYECGNYSGCSDYLYLYRGLVPTTDKVS